MKFLLLAVAFCVTAFGQAFEREAMKTLDEYMAAWNAKDVAAWEKTFQFPHFRLGIGDMRILEKPGMQAADLFQRMTNSGWHHTKWDHRKIVHATKDKIHVDTKFTRYRADGSVIGSYESLHILTFEGGRWGIKLRSSFAE